MKRLWVVATGQAPSEIQAPPARADGKPTPRRHDRPQLRLGDVRMRRRNCAGLWAARVTLVLSVPFGIVAWAQGADNAWLTYMLLPRDRSILCRGLFRLLHREPIRGERWDLAGRRGVLVAISRRDLRPRSRHNERFPARSRPQRFHGRRPAERLAGATGCVLRGSHGLPSQPRRPAIQPRLARLSLCGPGQGAGGRIKSAPAACSSNRGGVLDMRTS